EAVQELKSSRRFLRGRGRQRIDGDWRLLPLELVNRSYRDPPRRKLFGQAPDLGIEGRNDQHVPTRDLSSTSKLLEPLSPRFRERGHKLVNTLPLLVASVPVPLVVHVDDPQ